MNKSARPKQSETPLASALQACARRQNFPFHTPGHKRGFGTTEQQQRLFGKKAFAADLPELPELDNLFAAEGVILRSQILAAEAFGAEQTWFLANGSTCGLQAAILATCGPGDKIVLPRNAHISAIAGLILSGAQPIYITPTYSAQWDIPLTLSPQAVEQALTQHPDTKAVLLVSPTYHGICSDIAAIAQLTHARDIPLIVDEAHGPHFAFHPELPPTALQAGADIAVQSTHKVLSAFTQAALLHTQGHRIDRHKLAQSLQITQSTSPSYLLLASLDTARQQMAASGHRLLTHTLEIADRAAHALTAIPKIRVLQPKYEKDSASSDLVGDRTRLTVNVTGLGLTGFQADEQLHEQFGVTAELPSLSNLTFIVSIGNSNQDITQLIKGFRTLSNRSTDSAAPQTSPPNMPNPLEPQPPIAVTATKTCVTPRQTFLAKKKAIPIAQASGYLCAETICPYPPGIPILLPGEPITPSAINTLQTLRRAGSQITGSHDPKLEKILTVDTSEIPAP
ncbi:MAG: aminotransferase class I/II-fold pyridoxal phosphate-dependent enzyme [Cyanobacteria bacterium J06614_10]